MNHEKNIQDQISRYITDFLSYYFGEAPASVSVAVQPPFVAIHLLGFLLPQEKILLTQQATLLVLETRDLLMKSLIPEFIGQLAEILGFDISELYMDWNLQRETGFFLAISSDKKEKQQLIWPQTINKQALHELVIEISKKTQKTPDFIESYWLNDQTILIERKGIMVDIEKELIKNGVIEKLRLAKRPLEHRIMKEPLLETILNQPIHELFVDWNFEKDKAYLALLMNAGTN